MAQTLSSVSQALKILLLLQQRDDLGVSDIARTLDISSSSAHRLLATLLADRFVSQQYTGGKYQLGPAMRGAMTSAERVIEIGSPHMAALRDASAETVHLAVLRGTETHFLAAFESPRIMRVTSRVGTVLPAHATAAGKLLLAALSDSEIAGLYPAGHAPTGGAPGSILTVGQLITEVASARRDGYGRNLAESEVGVAALAVPLTDASGRTAYSLTVTGPDALYNPDHTIALSARETELLGMLRVAASRIEAELAMPSSPILPTTKGN